ncbi:MAG TPA: cyclic lactone autoinducer peptide [Desulfotomaculum sp.]|nr:cyclic lactone autoinducer peptide [Desulfotomaculum sp.]
MKHLYYKLLPVLFSSLVVIACGSIKPACWVWWYQPEVPKVLRK